jgi:membrane protein YqaA with SNARE-associated domain
MLKTLYNRVTALAESAYAPWALFVVAFSESSVFIVPPDVLLVPMALAQPKKSWLYAVICTMGSVSGGVAGYAIGHLLFDSVGLWILNFYHYADRIDAVKAAYAEYGAWVILLKGLTPIPYKLVTIMSGAMDYDLTAFVLLSLITRGARFFLLAGLTNRFGDKARSFIEDHLGLVALSFVVVLVIGFLLAVRVF